MLRVRLPAAAIIVLALLISGCAEKTDEAATEPAVEYETAVVTRTDVTAELETEGTVVAPPNEYAAIECSYCAPVSRVFATVGQSISKGDVIVELSHPDVRAAIDSAQVEVEQAREAQEEAKREYGSDVASAEARLEAAQTAEREAREALQDAQQQDPPPDDLFQLQVECERAHERRLRMEDRLEAAEERMDEALTPYRRRLDAAEQKLSEARAEQKEFMIATPIDGQLIELNVNPGDQPGQIGEALAVVADLSTLRVHARLSEEQARDVNPGMLATITLPAVPNMAFEGKVARLNTRLEGPATGGEGKRGYLAIIPFENTRGEAKPEMRAEVLILQGTAKDALVVPVEAIYYADDGQPYVNVQFGETWERREVVLGLSDDELVEVRMGLDEGDVVRLNPELVATPEP